MTPDLPDLEGAILRSNGGRCVGCEVAAEQVDHMKPRHAGGPSIPENLVPLCASCNKIKSCMWPGHGYHPFRGYDEPTWAHHVLLRELHWSEGIYGMSHLLATVGPDVPNPLALEREADEAGRRWMEYYDKLTSALSVELGARAYGDWHRAGRGEAWFRLQHGRFLGCRPEWAAHAGS